MIKFVLRAASKTHVESSAQFVNFSLAGISVLVKGNVIFAPSNLAHTPPKQDDMRKGSQQVKVIPHIYTVHLSAHNFARSY